MLVTITNTVNSASVVGNQLYDPYGSSRYQAGSMATSKGFTGQYNDSLTGLDYYGSRYYDPTAGVFLCADPMQGDLAATNPCEYVGANPETNTDPTGQMDASPPRVAGLRYRRCSRGGAGGTGAVEAARAICRPPPVEILSNRAVCWADWQRRRTGRGKFRSPSTLASPMAAVSSAMPQAAVWR